MGKPYRYIFLDRDGVLNRKKPEGHYVTRWSEFEMLPGVPEALARLKQSGATLIVVTNQSGISKGVYTLEDVAQIHGELNRTLAPLGAAIDAFFVCPHYKNDGCNCRKPKTGLFEQALAQFPQANAANSVVIGDSISDIEAAKALGWPSIFIHGDRSCQKPGWERAAALADEQTDSLLEAVGSLL